METDCLFNIITIGYTPLSFEDCPINAMHISEII